MVRTRSQTAAQRFCGMEHGRTQFFLIEITADIFNYIDPETNMP